MKSSILRCLNRGWMLEVRGWNVGEILIARYSKEIPKNRRKMKNKVVKVILVTFIISLFFVNIINATVEVGKIGFSLISTLERFPVISYTNIFLAIVYIIQSIILITNGKISNKKYLIILITLILFIISIRLNVLNNQIKWRTDGFVDTTKINEAYIRFNIILTIRILINIVYIVSCKILKQNSLKGENKNV